jgi:hypothetical protein
MNEDLAGKLDLAKRRKRAQELLPAWIAELERLTGETALLDRRIDLQETERKKAAFFHRLQSGEVTTLEWSAEERGRIPEHLAEVSRRAADLEIVLFSNVDRFIGAVRMSAHAVLAQPLEVWAHVGDDLCVASADLEDGLCLEQNYYRSDGQYRKDGLYELSTWGRFAR